MDWKTLGLVDPRVSMGEGVKSPILDTTVKTLPLGPTPAADADRWLWDLARVATMKLHKNVVHLQRCACVWGHRMGPVFRRAVGVPS
jgi:hypothetical protein